MNQPPRYDALAGLKKLRAQGVIRSGETVVLVLTGHTLKDADYTIDFHRGTLLTDEEKLGSEAAIEALRRDAITVEATPAAVLAIGRSDERPTLTPKSKPPFDRLACNFGRLGPGFDAVAVALDFFSGD